MFRRVAGERGTPLCSSGCGVGRGGRGGFGLCSHRAWWCSNSCLSGLALQHQIASTLLGIHSGQSEFADQCSNHACRQQCSRARSCSWLRLPNGGSTRAAAHHCTVLQVPVKVRELGVDLLTIVGHKFGAPKGVAALYIRSGVQLGPMFMGGGQVCRILGHMLVCGCPCTSLDICGGPLCCCHLHTL